MPAHVVGLGAVLLGVSLAVWSGPLAPHFAHPRAGGRGRRRMRANLLAAGVAYVGIGLLIARGLGGLALAANLSLLTFLLASRRERR